MKILAALDMSDQAESVLAKAASLAKEQQAELFILTVAEDFSDFGDFMDFANVIDKLIAQAQKAAASYKDKAKELGAFAQAQAVRGISPADAIVDYAQELGADLIVMGSRGKKGANRFLLGSVTAKVVSHSPCSVFVVK